MQTLLAERRGAAQVVAVVRVAPVDDGVVGLQERREAGDRVVDERGRDHDADAARRRQRADELLQRAGAGAPLAREPGDGIGADVVDDAVVATAHEPAHHVGAHAAQSDHPNLHGAAPYPVVCVATLAPGRGPEESSSLSPLRAAQAPS